MKLAKLLVLSFLFALVLRSQEQPDIDINRFNLSRLIPLSLTGYAGEAEKVLRFDLEIAGFDIVSPEAAQFQVTGKNGETVEGKVTDRISKAILLANSFTGGSTRLQAHALSDAIVQAILKKPGIARTKIAFKRDTGKESEIFTADYDGHNLAQVTSDRSIVAAPCWVPGRRMLFYTSYKSEFPDIYSHDLGSGERRVVAKYSGLNTSPSISPNGRRVAMILSKSGSPDVYAADLDGGNLLQLTKTREDESSPCWSPDGSKICFVSSLGGARALYVVPSGGGQMTRLRTIGVLNPTEPDWSPDGKSIVFTSQMGGFNICTIPAGGGNATVVTSGEDPSWAPNSRTVIFTRRINYKRILSLLDVPTKRVKDVAQTLGSSSQPTWAK